MMKMTYANAIDFAVEMIRNGEADFNGFTADEYIEKLDALKAQMAKRSSGKRGMTATQKANIELMDVILDGLDELNKPVTVTELINGYAPLAEYTNQKISALLRKMVDAEKVVKTVEKKKAYFAVA